MSETIIIRNDLHRSELGAANGVASLDVSGKVPDSQISVGSVTQHINDSGSTSTDIWSASKTQTQINTAVVGLLDDRGNFTPSGSYPTTGGSGTAGAILKGDIWQISGLGDGVSASVGTRSVSDGDWIRAVVDAPGQTDSNWTETASSSSNLGNSNLTASDNARTFTLKAGYTTSQYLQIQNTGGENLIKWLGDGTTQTRGQFFFNAAVNGGQELYVIRAKSFGGFEKFRVQAEDNQGIVDIWGNQAYQLISLNSTSTSYFYNSLAIGSATASARLDVTGSGSTSATTTALFKNSSSATSLEIKDDRTSIFGNISTSYIKLDPYGVAAFGILQFCAAGTTKAYNVYDSTNAERFRVETSGMVYAKRGSLSSYMNFNTSINLWAEGTSSSFHLVGTNGSNHTVYLGNDSSHGYAEIKNSSGVTQSRISGSGDSYFLNNLAVGVSSASARFHAKGSGNTSGTNTAIFQNSSSSAALTIKDDLTSTFGGVVTAPQIINTPSTVTVTANAGTVTRSYRSNNFTNSSAATMTITISLTGALDGDMVMVRIFDFSAVAQTITWVNTENSSITVPTTSNGSTTLPLTVGFQYNSATSKWRCVGSV